MGLGNCDGAQGLHAGVAESGLHRAHMFVDVRFHVHVVRNGGAHTWCQDIRSASCRSALVPRSRFVMTSSKPTTQRLELPFHSAHCRLNQKLQRITMMANSFSTTFRFLQHDLRSFEDLWTIRNYAHRETSSNIQDMQRLCMY